MSKISFHRLLMHTGIEFRYVCWGVISWILTMAIDAVLLHQHKIDFSCLHSSSPSKTWRHSLSLTPSLTATYSACAVCKPEHWSGRPRPSQRHNHPPDRVSGGHRGCRLAERVSDFAFRRRHDIYITLAPHPGAWLHNGLHIVFSATQNSCIQGNPHLVCRKVFSCILILPK